MGKSPVDIVEVHLRMPSGVPLDSVGAQPYGYYDPRALTAVWLDVVLALRHQQHAGWPEPAVALRILQHLAFRMQTLRERRRGEDPRFSGEVTHPAIAREVVRAELAQIVVATPDAEHVDVTAFVDIAGMEPALLQVAEDGNLCVSHARLHTSLARGGERWAAQLEAASSSADDGPSA